MVAEAAVSRSATSVGTRSRPAGCGTDPALHQLPIMGDSTLGASNSLGDGSRGVASSWGWGMPTFSDANRYADVSDFEDDEASPGPSVASRAAAVPSRRYSLPANFVGPLLDSITRPQVQEITPLVSKVARLKDSVTVSSGIDGGTQASLN